MEFEKRSKEEAAISGKLSFRDFIKSGVPDETAEVNPFRKKIGKKGPDPEKNEDEPAESIVRVFMPEVADPDKITITMLGNSGSGKTMFLSGVYQSLIQQSYYGISLVGDDTNQPEDSSLLVAGQIESIALSERYTEGRGWIFPVGTNRTTIYPLKLFYQDQEVSSFDFMDYAGGELANLLRVPDKNLSSDQTKLKQQLKKSDAILIFADAEVMANTANIGLCRSEIGFPVVNQILNSMRKSYADRSMTVLLILTKIDKVKGSMQANQYARLFQHVKNVFKPIWEEMILRTGSTENPWNFGVIPVTTVGRNNVVKHISFRQEREDGSIVSIEQDIALQFPEPENMDAAIVYAVASILKQKCREIQNEIRTLFARRGAETDTGAIKALDLRIRSLEEKWEKYDEYVTNLTLGPDVLKKFLYRKDTIG